MDGFCCVEEKLFGPVQFQEVTLPEACPVRLSVLPEQMKVELADANAEEGGAFTETLTVAVELPHPLLAVTV